MNFQGTPPWSRAPLRTWCTACQGRNFMESVQKPANFALFFCYSSVFFFFFHFLLLSLFFIHFSLFFIIFLYLSLFFFIFLFFFFFFIFYLFFYFSLFFFIFRFFFPSVPFFSFPFYEISDLNCSDTQCGGGFITPRCWTHFPFSFYIVMRCEFIPGVCENIFSRLATANFRQLYSDFFYFTGKLIGNSYLREFSAKKHIVKQIHNFRPAVASIAVGSESKRPIVANNSISSSLFSSIECYWVCFGYTGSNRFGQDNWWK